MPATTAPDATDDRPAPDLFIPVQQIDGIPDWGHEYVWVTPAMAQKWLDEFSEDETFRNRKVPLAEKRRLARLMTTNRFIHFLPSAPFCFDEVGILINGKTRLSACVESGRTIGVIVYRGVPRWMWAAMDTGRKKNDRDFAYGTYKEDKTAILAAMKTAWRYEEVLVGARPRTGWRSWGKEDDLQATDIERMYDKRGELVDYYGSAMAVRKGCKLVPQALMIFNMYQWYAWPEGRDTLEKFLDALREGANMSTGSPALSLRNFGRDDYCPTEGKPVIHLILLFRHFAAFAKNERVPRVVWAYGHELLLPYHPQGEDAAKANLARGLEPIRPATDWR